MIEFTFSVQSERLVMAHKTFRTLFIALVFQVVVIDVSVHSSGECPLLCNCDIWYGLQYASCIGRHLYNIHAGVPNTVQALDLSNNSISILNNYELADAGLLKLKYLNLSMNAISEISLNAFDGLSELTVLDLSQNHLYYLLSDIFISAKNLRILRLSKNNFNSHIPKLKCPSLTDLILNSCQISHLSMDTFVGLSHLRNLDISNNLLIQLDSIVLERLQFLKTLSIEGNLWSCDKLTHDLQIYLTRRNIQYRPVCIKNSEPKKFEKMIAYNPQIKYEKHRPSITLDSNIKRNTIATKKRPALIYKNTTCVNATSKTNFTKTLNAISPYWFFAFGFLLGSACGMFMCYIWLAQRISCCRGYHRRRDNDTQRISLLHNLWQFEDAVFHEDTISCPDTPPPPYNEVILRPGLYRNPSVTT